MNGRAWLFALSFCLAALGCASLPGTADTQTKAVLAPTGKLRVAFLGAPLYAVKDPTSGAYRGVAIDLGRELARRLDVPFEPMAHPTIPALLDSAKNNAVDVILMGISAERAAVIDFTAPYMEVEQGYLVRAGVPITRAEEVDRAGVRIGVLESAGADVTLSKTIKSAQLVRVKNVGDLVTAMQNGGIEVAAMTKSRAFEELARMPGARVLDGRFLVEPIGMGMPKGREAAARRYLDAFVEEAKAAGLVARAIGAAGLRGVAVAPPAK